MSKTSSLITAKRLKELREGKKISHMALSRALKEQYDIDISRDSLMCYEVSDPNHTKAFKNEGMRIEYLRCLSEFYNVSSDYLLGLTDDRSRKPCAADELGLSDLAIESVRRYTNSQKKGLTQLLENEVFSRVCDGIAQYMNIPNSDKPELYSDDMALRYIDFAAKENDLEEQLVSQNQALNSSVKVLIGYNYAEFIKRNIIDKFEQLIFFLDRTKNSISE